MIKTAMKEVKRYEKVLESITCDFCGKHIPLSKNLCGTEFIKSNCYSGYFDCYDSLGRIVSRVYLNLCPECADKLFKKKLSLKEKK